MIAPPSSVPAPVISPEMLAASSMANTFTLIGWLVEPPRSSVIVTAKESVPLKLAFGLYDQFPDAASMEATPWAAP